MLGHSLRSLKKRKVRIELTPAAPQADMLPLHNIRHLFSLSLYLVYKDCELIDVCAMELKLEMLSLATMNKPLRLYIHDYWSFEWFISL